MTVNGLMTISITKNSKLGFLSTVIDGPHANTKHGLSGPRRRSCSNIKRSFMTSDILPTHHHHDDLMCAVCNEASGADQEQVAAALERNKTAIKLLFALHKLRRNRLRDVPFNTNSQ